MSVNARRFVSSIPNVITAGGAALGMNAVEVDNTGDTSIPLGTLQKFGSSTAVTSWYGANSPQAAIGAIRHDLQGRPLPSEQGDPHELIAHRGQPRLHDIGDSGFDPGVVWSVFVAQCKKGGLLGHPHSI